MISSKSKILWFLLTFFATLTLSSCYAPKPDILIPSAAPPAVVPTQSPRVALVLGGGGARGYAHIGVLKVLEQKHIPIDLIVGASVGSMMGAMYADNPNADQLEKRFINAKRSDFIDISLIHALRGPITGNALQDYFLKHMQARDFKQLKIKLIIVATDLKSGATIAIDSGPIAPAVNASAGLPPYIHPVQLYGYQLIDGGMSDPVPVDIALNFHPAVTIAVDIARSLPPKMPETLIGIKERATAISLWRFDRLSADRADVVLRPDVGYTSATDFADKKQLIAAGERAARQALPKICMLLKQHNIQSGCAVTYAVNVSSSAPR